MKKIRNETQALLSALFAFTLASCGGGATVPQGASHTSPLSQPLSVGRAPAYRLIVLGNGIIPNKINNAGIVVGEDLNTNRPFEYKDGKVTDLPLWPGDTVGGALDINNREQIVGFTLNPDVGIQNLNSELCSPGLSHPVCAQTHAVLYQRGRIINLGSIPGPTNWSNSADLINDAGEIVGESGFLPSAGGSRSITIFVPGPVRAVSDQFDARGFPAGLNNAGEIVGAHSSIRIALYAYPNPIVCSPPLIFLDDEFTGINNAGDTISGSGVQGPVPSVYCQSGVAHQLQLFPSAINDGGKIVGTAEIPQTVVYSSGRFYKTGPSTVSQSNTIVQSDVVSGTKLGRNYFISNDGKIKGYILSISPEDAVLYSKGTYYDLNNLVPNHPDLILRGPRSINNQGEIVGADLFHSIDVGWLLVPR